MKAGVWVLGAAVLAGSLHAEEAVEMEPVTVVARLLRGNAPRNDVAEWSWDGMVAMPPFAELRQQGEGSPQADLTIRGGAFNMAGIAVAGLTLKNAQTEHWNVDLPLSMAWFKAPALLTGLDRFRNVAGHPSGTVALEVASLIVAATSSSPSKIFNDGDGDVAATIGGGGGLAFANGIATYVEGMVGGSAFLSFDRADRTDGVKGNDLMRVTGGGRIGFESERVQADAMAGYSWREFGAAGFYGTNPNVPANETRKDAMVLGTVSWTGEDPVRLTAGWLRAEDFYEMPTLNYQSEHVTDYIALHGKTRQHISEAWSVDVRTDVDIEDIDSTSLGDYERLHGAFAVLPNFAIGAWTFSAGGGVEFFSSDRPFVSPAFGVVWQCDKAVALFASYTESVRLPSYTEFNYNSPASLGNRGLKRQTARLTEVGGEATGDGWQWRTTLFYEDARNTVDWIRTEPESSWVAYNLEKVRTVGMTMDGFVDVLSSLRLTGAVMLLSKAHDDEAVYASRYALDYPAQTVEAGVEWWAVKSVVVRLTQGVAVYRDNPVRTSSRTAYPARLQAEWTFPWHDSVSVLGTIDNLWGDDFQTYAGQPVFGRRVSAALRGRW